MDDSDIRWQRDKDEHGWQLPPRASWPLRLPIIRNIRGAWIMSRAEKYAFGFASMGIGIGGVSQYDRWVIYAIFRGWC